MLRALLRRLRRFLTADLLAEISALRAEVAVLRQDMTAHDAKIEAALLTIALAKTDDAC